MKICEGFVKRELMGETVLVPTGKAGEKVKGMIRLNSTGAYIWDKVEAGMEIPEIADKLCDDYEVEREKALKDVQKIVDEMKKAGVFVE